MNRLGIEIKNADIAKFLGLKNASEEAVAILLNKIEEKIKNEIKGREEFALKIVAMSNEELTSKYVPTVYQKDIYSIDYTKLKENGVKLLSFDIDDTIDDSFINKAETALPGIKISIPPKAKKLFTELKQMGFTVVLLTNATEKMAKDAYEAIGADGYIGRAEKPDSKNFEKLQQQYGVEKTQMAHIGNSLRDDIVGGNTFGITTCLVRRAGKTWKAIKFVMKMVNVPTKGHLIREELKKRSIWRKHHKYEKNDQYYQLGETPAYLK